MELEIQVQQILKMVRMWKISWKEDDVIFIYTWTGRKNGLE